jgi:hypothetical protein
MSEFYNISLNMQILVYDGYKPRIILVPQGGYDILVYSQIYLGVKNKQNKRILIIFLYKY